MPRAMSLLQRMPLLAFALLSILLSIAIIGCAGRTLDVYNSEHASNAWLLPLWPQHFDTRGLQALIGISSAILILNAAVALVSLLTVSWSRLAVLVPAALSTILSIVAIIFPAVLNNAAPTTDTLQTWTCRWSETSMRSGAGAPSEFTSMCQESRFAFYTTIPVFVIQLVLLGLAIFTLLGHRSRGRNVEKGSELDHIRLRSGDVRADEHSVKDSGHIVRNEEVR